VNEQVAQQSGVVGGQRHGGTAVRGRPSQGVDHPGSELEQGLAGGGSDGNTTSQYTATLDGLGPVGDGAHAPHEYLNLEQTTERAALLTLILLAPPLEDEPMH